ncbi:MAG: phosphatase PAP2 family protein [archaeon]
MKRGEIFFIIFIAVLGLASFYFDAEIVKFISELRNIFLDEFFLGITFVSSEIIIFFFLTSLFLWQERKRKWILPLWLTLFLSVITSFLLKISFHRLRPFQIGITEIHQLLESSSYLVWNFSFPSFQSMLGFCAIPILSREFPRFKYVWIAFAFMIAFSRVYFGLHFLSDAIAGGLIGYLIGFIIVRKEKENKFWEKVYRKFFRR